MEGKTVFIIDSPHQKERPNREIAARKVDADHLTKALQFLPHGDFDKTLRDRERFLQEHARLQSGKSRAATNFAWWTTTERDVNNLPERANFHITIVALIAGPFEFRNPLEIQRELQLFKSDVAHYAAF